MVYIRKKKERENYYYYMEHSQRIGGKIKKYSKYIGKELPDDEELEMVYSQFFNEIYESTWIDKLDTILINYGNEMIDIPKVVIDKSINDFSIRFTYNSNRIEGNTLKLRDTKLLLEDGLAPAKKMDDIKETEAHQKVFFDVIEYEGEIDEDTLLKWHYDLLRDTQFEIAGTYRKHNVAISGSEFTPIHHVEVEVAMQRFFDWLNKGITELILHPIELGALAHLKLVTIHPFSDGNGRISRLLMNWIFNRYNFPMLIIEYKRRASYYSALERSQTKKQPYIFISYIFRNYIKANQKYQ